MRFTSSLAAAATMAIAAFTWTAPAQAGGGDAVVGGAVGFALGTLFGNATAQPRYYAPAPAPVYVAPPPAPAVVYYVPEPWTPDWYAYCGQRYRSFDARSGTFIGYDGYRHMCR